MEFGMVVNEIDPKIFREIERGNLGALRRLVEETATSVKQPLEPPKLPVPESQDGPSRI
jgi:hypothetical protein